MNFILKYDARGEQIKVFSELHKFLNNLGPMECTLAAKNLTMGYKPRHFGRAFSRFATLYGEKRYSCLILHVDPGNKESVKGKIIQKEIQVLLGYDIKEMRGFALKRHEVYIPFEVIGKKQRMEILKEFIRKQYEIFIKKSRTPVTSVAG